MRTIIALAILLPTMVLSQGGRFTTGDASSFGAEAGIGFGDNSTALNLSLGPSWAGALDGIVGLSLGKIDEDEYGEDWGFTQFSAGLTVRPTQPTPELPLIVELSVGVFGGSYQSDTLDDLEIDWTLTGWNFELGVGAQLIAGPNMMFVPMFSVSRIDGTVKIEDRFGDWEKDNSNGTNISMATSLVFGGDGPQSFVLNPEVSRYEGEISFSLSAMVLFSGKSTVRPQSTRGRYGETIRQPNPYTTKPTQELPSPPLPVPSTPVRWVRSESLTQITAAVPDWTTVEVGQLSEPIQDALAGLFDVPRQSMGIFSHGPSAAPSGHAHHGSSWFTIGVEDDSYSGTVTLIISSVGRVIESKFR